MGDCYIYFGDRVYSKLQNVKLNKNMKKVESEFKTGLVFDYIYNMSKKCTIDDIYPSWFYILFRIGFKLLYAGYNESISSNDPSVIFDSTQHNGIKVIACCWNGVAIVTNNYKFFFQSTDDLKQHSPIEILPNEEVENVHCTDTQCFIYTKDCKLFSIDDLRNPLNSKQIDINFKIAQIACGKEHSLFLTEMGSVYSVGIGSRGQLGQGDTNSLCKPTLIEALDGVPMKLVSAGGWHSASLSTCGDLYIWGWNESGQLGFPCSQRLDGTSLKEIEVVCCLPKLVNLCPDIPVKDVSCGSRHTAALSEQGHFWTWGSNIYGQLGIENCNFVDIPTLVHLPSSFTLRKLICCYWSTFIHNVYESNNNMEVLDYKSNG